MTRHRILMINCLILALSLSIFAPGCSKHQAADYEKLKYPKLGDIQMPQIKQVTLANGMKLFLLEDHELPLISVSAIFEQARSTNPPKK